MYRIVTLGYCYTPNKHQSPLIPNAAIAYIV